MSDYYTVMCPSCQDLVVIYKNELNCRICCIQKQYAPHTNKNECDRLFESGEVYGCAKPFRVEGNNEVIAFSCDYI